MSISAMKQALQALELIDKDIEWHDKSPTRKFCNQAAHFLRQAIEQAEKQEPDDIYDVWKEQKPVYASDISQEPVDETAKREHEPIGYINGVHGGYMVFTPINPSAVYLNGTALFLAPPKREWVGLTHEERDEIDQICRSQMEALFVVEAKLKEKNGG